MSIASDQTSGHERAQCRQHLMAGTGRLSRLEAQQMQEFSPAVAAEDGTLNGLIARSQLSILDLFGMLEYVVDDLRSWEAQVSA